MLLASIMQTTPLDPRDESPHAFIEKVQTLGISEKSARRWLGAVIGNGLYSPTSWHDSGVLGKRFSPYLAQLPALTHERTVISPVDNFQKLLFRTADGLPIESVAIPLLKPGSVSICLSSQVGCVMGCTFCATARMPTRRNLSTWEIIDQFIQTRALVRASGRTVTGAVFMGMGEPFLNYNNVLAAAELINFPVQNALTAKAITISTVGLVQEIDRFTNENRPFRLSISLGAATDEKRALLVPVAARTPLSVVMSAARRHALAKKDRVMLSYVCIGGVNVSDDDARALGELIGDTQVRLDLIEVTDSTGRYSRPTGEEMSAFRDALRKYVGQPVARRYSGGSDIAAACGTLAGGVA